jgi:hypothetical protein
MNRQESLESDSHGDSTDQPDTREELRRVRQELTELRPDILDDELRGEVTSVLVELNQLTSASTEDHIMNVLASLKVNHPMYRTEKHQDGTTAFPDKCRGCEHYGVRCPVIKDRGQRRRRERIMSESGSEDELRRRLRDYAIDNDCRVIIESLEEVGETMTPLLRRASLLLMAVEERVLFTDAEEHADAILSHYREIAGDRSVEIPSVDDPELPPESDADAVEHDANSAGVESNGATGHASMTTDGGIE